MFRPVVINKASFGRTARPAFLHTANTAAFDASSLLLLFGRLWLGAAMKVDWQMMDAIATALHEGRVIFQAAPCGIGFGF